MPGIKTLMQNALKLQNIFPGPGNEKQRAFFLNPPSDRFTKLA